MLAYKRNKQFNTLFEIVFLQIFVIEKESINVFPDYFGDYLTNKVGNIVTNKYEYFLQELQLFKTSELHQFFCQKTNSVTKIVNFLQRCVVRTIKILKETAEFRISHLKCFHPAYQQLDRIFDNLVLELNNLGTDERPVLFINQELRELSNRPV